MAVDLNLSLGGAGTRVIGAVVEAALRMLDKSRVLFVGLNQTHVATAS